MLVGREPERRDVGRRLAAARSGAGGVLVVAGDAGVGKTALLEECARGATGMRVLRAVGAVAEVDLPFAGLDQLVRPLLPLAERLPRPQASALARALAVEEGPPPERFAVGAATLAVLSRAAEEQPLLVVVDDLHHLDRPSADAVLFAARRLPTDPVAVLVGVRPDAGADDLVAGLDRLDLAGLGPTETRGLVAGRGLTAGQLDRLHALTAGNPLAALAMAAYPDLLADDRAAVPVPRLIEEAYAVRTRTLAPATRTALLIAAVGDSDPVPLARACAAAGVDVADLAGAERAGLVEVAGRVRFPHPLLRAAVRQAASPDERRAAHRHLAGALSADDLDRRAWHLAEAALGVDDAVARVLDEAATSARARAAFAVAARRSERAAGLSADAAPRARRLADAGEAAWLAGLPERSRALLAEAARSAPDGVARARATALGGVVTARSGRLDDGRDLLLDAAAATAAGGEVDEAVLLLAETVYTCFYLGDGATTAEVVARLDGLDRTTQSPRARVLGDLAVGMGLSLLGRGADGIPRLRRAVAEAGGLVDDPRWLPWLLLGPIWLRESGAARVLLDAGVVEARERAALGTLPLLLFLVARDDATTDRWADAEAGFREAVGLAGETGLLTDEAMSLCGLTWLLARQGRAAEARDLAARAEAACARSRLHLGRTWTAYARGDLAAGAGDPAAAVAAYRSQQRLVAELGIGDPDLSPACELVEGLVALGESGAARAEAEACAEAARAKGQPWALARAHRALALAGPHPEADYAAALELHARTPDHYETARTRLALGGWLRRTRRRAEAREVLRVARATFDRLAARPWAEAAVRELAATGERVPRRTGDAVQGLTPQELQVARLLAGGRTTREAAAALFLSPKTVEYHLRHVYIKLGIGSRRELEARVAADPRLRPQA